MRARPLRIAHVTATFPPYWGGTGNVAYHNAREMARRGHEVTVVTVPPASGQTGPAPDGLAVRYLRALLRIGNAPVAPGLVGIQGFDVVHLHYPFIVGAELVAAAAARRAMPYVLTHHNDLVGDGWRRPLFATYFALSARLVLGGARKIGVVSLDHAASCRLAPLLKRRWDDVVEVPNGVDARMFHPERDGAGVRDWLGVGPGAPVVLFVGAMDRAHHFKGVPCLLRAFARMGRRDAILVLVGDGDRRESYVSLARALGIAPRVRFVGGVPNADLPPYYAAADVVVLPSFPPESFGVVLIEAMACGRPVVAHAIPGVRGVVDDGTTGLLAAPGDEADLAAKIQLLLEDAPLRARLGAAGRRKVEERYDWRVVGDRLEMLYREVCASSG
ncbi:MAG TPA: glycosyltransferase family 4 protein [Chloroflexota bacterium]